MVISTNVFICYIIVVVNVWGQHGFGKSYIVKNLASRMFNWEPFGVEYTDCR